MNDPWTWTTVWRLTVGEGGRLAEESKGGKTGWDNCNRTTIKYLIKKELIFHCE